MKIVLHPRGPMEKPIERPRKQINQSLPPVKIYESPKQFNPPVKVEKGMVKYEPPISSKFQSIKETINEKRNEKVKFAFTNPENTTFKISPIPSTKNDKVNLFIDAYANKHKELYNMINDLKWDEKGIHIPEQDKVFFETVITNMSFDQYVTTNKSMEDFTRQQIDFVWFKSPVNKVIEKEFYGEAFHNFEVLGVDFKLEHNSGLAIKMAGENYSEKPLREFLELSKTLLTNEKVVIQFGFQPCENTWWKEAEQKVKELRKGIKVSHASKGKVGYPGFDCSLRLIVFSKDSSRLENISRGYIMALKQLDGDNKLIGRKVKSRDIANWLNKKVIRRKIDTYFKFNKRFILTLKEIKNFIKLPQRTLQKDFDLEVNEREEITVHKSLQSKSGLPIGYSVISNQKHDITIPFSKTKQVLDDFMKTYVFMGAPRTGKDTSQCNFIIEAAKLGCGAIVPDVINEQGNDRGMADTLRDAIPREQLVDVDICDPNYPIYLGFEDLIELIGDGGIDEIASDLVKILDLEEHYASKQLTRLVAKACRCNLYDMYCFLKSDVFAEEVYKQLLTSDELLALQVKNEYLDATIPANVKGAVLSRIDDLLGVGIVKNMFAQHPSNRFNLKKFIQEKKVVIIRMKKTGGVGEFGARVLMNLLTLKVFRIKKMLENDTCTFMVFNEPHQYMSKALCETLEDMLLECPKYRLGLLFAFHHPAKLPSSLWDNMQTASMNFFLFKNTNFSVYKQMAEQLKPIDVDIAMKTEKYESIFLPYIEGKQLTPIFVKMLPPAKERQEMFDNSDLTRQHALKYGTPITLVKQRIKEREISMYKKAENDEEKTEKKTVKPRRKKA